MLKRSIEDCVGKGRVLSCLTLLYSAIDILLTIEKRANKGTRHSFVRWVDSYMLPNDAFQFSALDLYAARCGIIHLFSGDSDLSRKGQAKRSSTHGEPQVLIHCAKLGRYSGAERSACTFVILSMDSKRQLSDTVDDVADHPHQHRHFCQSIGDGW